MGGAGGGGTTRAGAAHPDWPRASGEVPRPFSFADQCFLGAFVIGLRVRLLSG